MLRCLVLLSTFSALTACAGEDEFPLVAPEAVHAQIEKGVGESLTQINAAVAHTRTLMPTASTLTRLAHLFGSQTPLAQLARSFAPAPGPFDAATVVDYLDSRVFSEATYEGRGSYRFDPALVCAAGDTACDDAFAALDLHLWVSTAPAADTLVIAVRIGADEPIQLTLTPDELNVAIDLDVLARSAPRLSAAFGLPPLALSGALSAIVRSDDDRGSLFVSIDRPVAIRAGDDFALASSKVGIVMDAIAFRTYDVGSIDLDLGATRVMRRVAGRQLAIDLAALTMAAGYLDRGEPLILNNLGVGDRPAVFSIDGVPAQTVEINPDDGHQVDVFFQLDDGAMLMDASPRLDLRFKVDHAVLGDTPPPFEVTRVQLDGRLQGLADDRFEVLTGGYAITTVPAAAGVRAAPGQCVTTTDAPLAWTVSGACK